MATECNDKAHESSHVMNVATLATLTLYVWSCFLPATDIGRISPDDPPMFGWFCLLFGWTALFSGWPAWCANFVLWAAIAKACLGRLKWALRLAVVGTILAISAPLLLRHMLIGYYVWQASFLVFTAGVFAEVRLRKGSPPGQRDPGW